MGFAWTVVALVVVLAVAWVSRPRLTGESGSG
jgi:hypothetical protein